MPAAFYADYVADLRAVFSELDQHPERFQTFSLHIDLAAAGSLIVYETKRRRGQTDSIYYGRPLAAAGHQKISQATAFAAIDRFLALGQFLALKADAGREGEGGLKLHEDYPHCAFNFSYRKKGHPASRSMLMIFVGFNDDADAGHFASTVDDASILVASRPYSAERIHEWR